MKFNLRLFTLFLCMIFLVACQQKSETPRSALAPAPASAPSSSSRLKTDQIDKQATDKTQKDITVDISKRKIIKEGELSFETGDFNRTKVFINKSVSEVQGYIAEEHQEKYDDRIVSNVVIRVPAEKFDSLVDTLSSSAEVVNRKYIKVLDVTEEYIDVEARLKTRKDIENRYRQLLGQAKKVEDVLSIEKQLGELREQIESAEGKLKYLNDRIALSTLTVSYSERIGAPMGFTSKFISGLRGGWKNFALFVIFLAEIWPFIVLAIVAIIIIRKIRNRQRIKKEKKAE